MKLPEIEISIRYKGAKKADLKKISTASDINEILKEIYDADTVEWVETMILLCLNQNNKVIGFYKVSQGGTTGTVCDPKIIYTVALNCAGTTSIILSHNHPSGSLQPSRADEDITRKIKDGGKMLDIKLLDHIIYTTEGFYSFEENGIL